ncbi:nitrite reductase small subunit NirD [Brevibacillus sp. SYSU BS000544]|uniref:nitrite reductase small subunit NirD n=1 Tax=Brevibacillus sp. SYSU BS000544 TaxID=3416443 RepID=UPI003CE5BA99
MKRILVGNVGDIKKKSARTIWIGRTEIAVFKLSSGEIRAIENRCPHKGGILSEGIVCDHYVFCPMHDWKIDMNNGLVQEPDEGSVKTYAVEVDQSNGELYLLIENEDVLAS